MTPNILDIGAEIDAPEDIKVKARRQFTYSAQALQSGAAVEKIFVNHTATKQALEAFDRAIQLTESISVTQGLRLIGPTGSGKTTSVRYFQASLPSDGQLDDNTRTLYLRLQERPSVSRLISALLRVIRYPFASVTAHNLSLKRDILIEALRQRGTTMLFLDEAHYLCQYRRTSNPDKLGTYATDFLRELIDEAHLVLVLIGDHSLDRLPEIDAHLAARTPIRIVLQNFEKKDAIWLGVVKTILNGITEIGMSILLNNPGMQRLHAATGGNMRQLKWLISEAVMVGLDAKQSEARDQDMALAFKRLNGPACERSNPWEA